MKCPNCQTENREGRKFCGQCGAKLGWKCPGCGFDNEADEKFCGGCGKMFEDAATPSVEQTTPTPKLEDMHARLQSVIPQSLEEKYTAAIQADSRENRPVTALFADISGFTPLSTKLSSEAVFQLVEECFNTLVNIVAGYEGKISGFRGDGLLALFGAPILHENDAERAILAALDMRNAMLEKQLQVSIGINTATMTVGEITTTLHSEYIAHSVEINLAARLQQTAQPGQILVGAGTYRLTRRTFDFQRIEGLSLRGIGEGIVAYEALHVKEHPEKLRGIEGLRARMIGREREFADLKEAADKLLAGEGQMVSVIGEAGIGKSRLVTELKTYLNEKKQTSEVLETSEVYTLEGRCVSIGNTISYWPILDMLRSYFGLSEDESEKDVARKVVENITRMFPKRADDILPFFGHLMSIRFGNELDGKLQYYSPEQIMHQTLMRLRDFLVTIAREKPLLLILEDLHWADTLSLELIMQLMDELVTTPLMFLCVYRPSQETEIEPRLRQLPGIAERKCVDRYTEINLKQLSTLESRQLVETLLAIDNLPESVKEMILQRSEGNPFFIEEVIRSLLDRDLIYREGERWKARGEIIDLDVPDTIQSVILARVDRLESEAKYVLQCASVIGRLFKYRLLEHLSRQERNLDQYLNDFEERDLVYEERAIPELEYAFKHALTQETTYQGILQQRRREFHLKVAQGIETLYRERIEEYYEELAYHYQKSPDKSKALEYLTKAGRKCFDAYAMQEAIGYYTDAIGLAHEISVDKEMIAELYQQRGEARNLIGEYEEQIADYKEALKYTARKDYRAMLYAQIANAYAWYRIDMKNAIEYTNLGRAELEGAGESRWTVAAYAKIGMIISNIGTIIEAREAFFRKGVEIAQRIGDKEGLLDLHRLILWAHHYYQEDSFEKVIALTSEVENPYALSGSYFGIGIAHQLRGNIPEALEFYHKAIELAERYSEVWTLAGGCGYLGRLYTQLNEVDKALDIHEKGWNATLKSRLLFMVRENYSGLLQLYQQRGETRKILGMIEDFLDMMDKAMAKEETEEDSPFLQFVNTLEGAYATIALSAELRARCQGRLEEGLERASNRMEVTWYLYQLVNFHLTFESLQLPSPHLTPRRKEPGVRYASRLVEMNPKIGLLILKPLLVIGDLESANEFVPGILQQPSADYDKLASVDLFDGDSLSPVWEWVDPIGDCTYELLMPSPLLPSPSGRGVGGEGRLQIIVPPGHDLWPADNCNAPRLLQTISGDFAIETKISNGEGGKKSGGLLVWKDEDNYIRFDTPSSCYSENVMHFEANVKGNYISPGLGLPDAKRLTLRLERQGHRFSAYCSMDDKNWFTCGWVDLLMDDPIQVGIHALCAWSPATSTRFEYFKILRCV